MNLAASPADTNRDERLAIVLGALTIASRSSQPRERMDDVVFEYRVTKYNPAFRESSGAYTQDEWTSVSDIGGFFDGIILTTEDYHRVENAYVAAACSFLRESGRSMSLAIVGLEYHGEEPIEYTDGAHLRLEIDAFLLARHLHLELAQYGRT